MNINEQIRKICFDLNIEFNKNDIQDWGIIHSDPNRIKEFIDYFNRNNLNSYMQYYIFELIVASYNDAILENLTNENLKMSFFDLLNKSKKNEKLNIIKNYWRKIYNEEEFPVGKLL